MKKTLTIKHSQANIFGLLRTSALLEIMTESAIEDLELLGAGKAATIDQGVVWVVVKNHLQISRMPEYGETVQIESRSGQAMHGVLFPRFFTMKDAEGKLLVSSGSLWALMDSTARCFVFPKEKGISLQGQTSGEDIPLPPGFRKLVPLESKSFTVPFSYGDRNGHMNNARYLDIAEDLLPDAAAGRRLKALNIEYAAEIKPGETFTLSWRREGNFLYLSGDGSRRLFRLDLEYRDDAEAQ